MDKMAAMEVLQEGYSDEVWEEYQKRKKQVPGEENKINFNFINFKNIVILIIWIALYKLCIKVGFGAMYVKLYLLFLISFNFYHYSYFSVSILVFIFNNLGKRKPWQMSAYSIFNPNCERLLGTMSVSDLQSGLGLHPGQRDIQPEINDNFNDLNTESNQLNFGSLYNTKSEIKKREMKDKASQPLNSLCSCGTNKKYKNCCLKKTL